jgi:capsular polysaccharide biosynthesis protein
MISTKPPLANVYSDVIATPTSIKQPPNGSISGCLYNQRGEIISFSQRFGGFYGDFFPCNDPKTIRPRYPLPKIEGASIYLGHLMPHYGHFLLEMLSSFWTFNQFHLFDSFIFHPFVFGTHFPPYIKEAFQRFNIPLAKVKLITTETSIEQVTVPERLVNLNKFANVKMRQVYQHLIQSLPRQPATTTRRYYFSRIQVNLKTGQRTVINEAFIQRALNRIGFMTIYPERLSFSEQMMLTHHAQIICGLSGSALHNCVFMQSNALLIEIADARSLQSAHPMQQICNQLSQVKAYFIPFSGYVFNQRQRVSMVKTSTIIAQIIRLLAQHQLNTTALKKNEITPMSHSEFIQINSLILYKAMLRGLKSWLTAMIAFK